MKTLYLKTTLKLLRLLPALIFFMLALSYTARSQYPLPNPQCYGQPIYLFCSLTGCDVPGATFTWTNTSGSWISNEENPVIMPGNTGYAEDRFYLQVQFAPPPGGFSGGSVKVNLLPEVFVTGTPTNILCYGLSTGAINITATGGRLPYSYIWSNQSTVRNQTGLAAGTYTVTVSDYYGCFKVGSWTVTQPDDIVLTGVPTQPSCNGGSNGSIDLTVTGGVGSYVYAWSTGAVTEDISGLTAGTYSVTVHDGNNCVKTGSWTVTQPDALTISGTPTDVSCYGGSNGTVSVTVGGGGVAPYSYVWNVPQTGSTITGLIAGTYSVTVTDANGCTISGSWTVGQPTDILVSESQVNVSCNGGSNGSINLSVSGGTPGYSFNWSNGAVSEDISNLVSGWYAVTVSDANGCQKFGNYYISQPYPLTLSGTPAPSLCNGGSSGSIQIFPGGGTPTYTFLWSNGETTQNISNLYAGPYTVVVTDANGCQISDTWTVGEPTAI